MWRLIFEFLTEPLGLPVEWYWEYIILAIIGFVAYIIAFRCVGKMYHNDIINSRGSGSFFHWLIRLIFFTIIWALTYGVISLIKWICDNWILVLSIIGFIALVTAIVITVVLCRKRNNKHQNQSDV